MIYSLHRPWSQSRQQSLGCPLHDVTAGTNQVDLKKQRLIVRLHEHQVDRIEPLQDGFVALRHVVTASQKAMKFPHDSLMGLHSMVLPTRKDLKPLQHSCMVPQNGVRRGRNLCKMAAWPCRKVVLASQRETRPLQNSFMALQMRCIVSQVTFGFPRSTRRQARCIVKHYRS